MRFHSHKVIFIVIISILGSHRAYAQVSSFQFAVPFHQRVAQLMADSLQTRENSFTNCTAIFGSDAGKINRLLPLLLTQQWNSNYPYGWNDEGMIPAKGYQVMASAGLAARWGYLHIQLYPQIVYASNNDFSTLAVTKLNADQLNAYRPYADWIDQPERYGSANFTKAYWGQSFVSIENSKLSFRLSTENKWWGPGVLNSLTMSNNAPGFPHLSFQTVQPLKTFLGNVEFEFLSGITQSSVNARAGVNKGDGYVNGLIISYQPKWTPGLFIGATRVYNQYLEDAKTRQNYFPVFLNLFRSNDKDPLIWLYTKQNASLFIRYVFQKAKTEVYAEYGRNDAAYNIRDLLLSPEHSRAYLVGASKLIQLNQKDEFLHLQTEMTQMESPPSDAAIRVQSPSWYVHGHIRRGYTQLGKVIGAGIGPGSNCRNISCTWIKGDKSMGVNLMQVERNKELYDRVFANVDPAIQRQWVDNVIGVYGNFRFGREKKCQLNWNADFIHSKDFHWSLDNMAPGEVSGKRTYNDNLHLKMTMLYWF